MTGFGHFGQAIDLPHAGPHGSPHFWWEGAGRSILVSTRVAVIFGGILSDALRMVVRSAEIGKFLGAGTSLGHATLGAMNSVSLATSLIGLIATVPQAVATWYARAA